MNSSNCQSGDIYCDLVDNSCIILLEFFPVSVAIHSYWEIFDFKKSMKYYIEEYAILKTMVRMS